MSEKIFKGIGAVFAGHKALSWLNKPVNFILNRAVSDETREDDATWNEESEEVILEQTPVKARSIMYMIALVLIVLITWAWFAEIDELTRGEGKVVPSKQVQVVQSLDGGIVTELLVGEGQIVKQGDPLVRIDETRAKSSVRENKTQYLAYLAKQVRLKALAKGTSFNPPSEVKNDAPQTYAQEYALFNASRAELQSSLSISENQVTQREKELLEVRYRKENAEQMHRSASQELETTRPLLASGAVSEIDILKLDREVSRAQGEIDQAGAQMQRIRSAIKEAKRKVVETEQMFKSKVRTELNEVTAKLNSVTETSVALNDKVKQATLLSPVNGTISKLHFNTLGGVIQPGKEVLEIVPSDDALVIETKVQIKDIAFLVPDQPAIVKLTAYDYTIYGSLDAVVESIAANSTVDEEGNAFYLVRVRTLKPSLGEGLSIIPGMSAQVDIMTGKKTIMSYLLKPVLKAKAYAFTER
jgi:adhesin transport system membrane fusion protein